MAQPEIEWWGYLHINGNIQVKRYFDDRDLDDAYESDFVSTVFHPFKAAGREAAIKHIEGLLEDM